MPDIAMCMNGNCPSRTYCYRFTARPNELSQAYAGFKPPPGEDACDYYMPNFTPRRGDSTFGESATSNHVEEPGQLR
mgnify:CR=1 FL=1